MVIRTLRFNIYLLLFSVLGALTGCQSAASKREHQLATVRIHLESKVEIADHTEVVSIFRAVPIAVNVVKEPFLNESMLSAASLVEEHGGYALKIEFNRNGQTLLEQYSAANPNRRFAIRSQFGVAPNLQDRWLGAPLIQHRIKDGVLLFTPDATLAEVEQIVLGLNNHAEETGEKIKPKP